MKLHVILMAPFVLASAAWAEPATDAGAAHLTSVFRTYLGQTPGVVSVTPAGDHYAVTLDATPLIGLGKSFDLKGAVVPFEMSLTDEGNGLWQLSYDQAFSMVLSVPQVVEAKLDMAQATFEGIFDESLMAVREGKGGYSGLKMEQTELDPTKPASTTVTTTDRAEMTQTARLGPSGRVDVVVNQTTTGYRQTMSGYAGPEVPPMQFALAAERMEGEVKGTGLAMAPIFDLVAWLVAHPDAEAIKANKSDLKGLLAAGIPFFDSIEGNYRISGLSAETPLGPFLVKSASATVTAHGAVPDGLLRERLTLSGVTPPPGLVPEWALPVLPQEVVLDIQGSDFDAAGGVTALLGAFDLPEGMADTTEFDQKLLAAWLPKGKATITLNPGSVTGPGYQLTYQGAMQVGPGMEAPTGSAVVTLTGVEQLNAALEAAPEDVKAQAMMGFGMAQAMAKTEGDKLIWEIDAPRPGALTVNGMPMMGGN